MDPKALVLRPPDVPEGFEFASAESRYWPNSALRRTTATQVIARSYRINGYQADYQKRVGSRVQEVLARADVFRSQRGASIFFDWFDRDQRRSNAERIRQGAEPYARLRTKLGEGAWIYARQSPPEYVLLLWRQGRVVAWIHSWGLGVKKTQTLAKAQQRRMTSALR